jgi:hypothetical protein
MENLVRNAGFETDLDDDGIPDGWEPFDLRSDRRTVEYSRDQEVARTGAHSVKITRGSIYGDVTGVGAWAQRDVVVTGGGRTFTLSAYVRASEPTQVTLYLYGSDPEWGDDFDGAASEVFQVETEWQKVSHTNSFGPAVEGVHVVLARTPQTFGGDVWFDDVELIEEA